MPHWRVCSNLLIVPWGQLIVQNSEGLILVFGCFQIPGLLSLSTKFFPTVMNLLRRLAMEGQKPTASERPENHSLASKSFRSGVDNNGESSSSASSN
ncbi:hypothetical protein U1Q18_026892, partial [Sarracenia purpurea var. burkii]